jgi:hypothetical protein
MSGIRRFAIGVVLAVVIGAPILEAFDRWDQTMQDGNDTESNLVIVAICVGLAFSIVASLLTRLRGSLRSRSTVARIPEPLFSNPAALEAPLPNSRPPTTLRV